MTKTPDPKKPGGDQNPQNMGGPAFNPQLDKAKESENLANDEAATPDTEILREDQVPPL